MRFFLYSYSSQDNYEISREYGVFGCKFTKDGLPTKFEELRPGDIIVIRDSRSRQILKFFGCCLVIGQHYYHGTRGQYPYQDLLWTDEQEAGRIIYPYRIQVDFNALAATDLYSIGWKDLLALGWTNKKGRLFDKRGFSLFFKGNFVEEGKRFPREQVEAFANLIGIQHLKTPIAKNIDKPTGSERILCTTYRILRDTAIARKVKLLHLYKCQIWGDTIPLSDGRGYAESHHIKPLGSGHNGPDVEENIICVCPNHHVQLDYGVIRLGKSNLRSVPGHVIGDEYISYHNDQIWKH